MYTRFFGKQQENKMEINKRKFYRQVFALVIPMALQNLINVGVTAADVLMLGRVSEKVLSGASLAGQIQFVMTLILFGTTSGATVLTAQYWGKKDTQTIEKILGMGMTIGVSCAALFTIVAEIIAEVLLHIYTSDPAVIAEGVKYLRIVALSYVLMAATQVYLYIMRSIEQVVIATVVYSASLICNVLVNALLIFGLFGLPKMGIMGAAIGTLVARILELVIVVIYIIKDKKIELFKQKLLQSDDSLRKDYMKAAMPIILAQILWGVSVPMQTAILGHLSDDAIAANSVATTFYQYLKVIVIAMTSASAVMMGNGVGRGNMKRIRSDARTLATIDVAVGIVLGIILFALKNPLLSMYQLSGEALRLADHLIVIMSFVMVGMSYQMPVSAGIIQGGGDTKFNMVMSMISTWAIVMPLSFAAAFWWKLPVELVVIVIQSDQFFKGIPAFIRFRSYRWVKKLTN